MHAFFRTDDQDGTERLLPEDRARSGWGGSGPGQIRGTAVSGALARAAERTADGLDDAAAFRPVRWTLDLFRPAAMVPATVTASVVRQGRKLRLVDTFLHQDDRVVARGTALFLATGGTAAGALWGPPARPLLATPDPPAPSVTADLPPGAEPMLFHSADVGWTVDATPHRNASRKMVWYSAVAVVAGESPSGFQHAATVADTANMVANWGTGGIAFINADLTLALTRVPAPGADLGLVAEQRVEDGGIALASTTLVDADGPVGTVLISTVVQGGPVVDPSRFDADRADVPTGTAHTPG